jgi:hypothetical protein
MEIGRYDLTSSGSKPGFLTIGAMNGFLNGDGNRPQEVDRQHMVTEDVIQLFKTDFGIGSAAGNISGSPLISVAASPAVTESKHRSVEDWDTASVADSRSAARAYEILARLSRLVSRLAARHSSSSFGSDGLTRRVN